jgi:hypothetical protein
MFARKMHPFYKEIVTAYQNKIVEVKTSKALLNYYRILDSTRREQRRI